MDKSLTQLPPPPKGQTGIPFQSLKGLPPPPTGQKGMTMDQINTPQQSHADSIWSKIAGVGKGIVNAVTSSEQAFGQDIAAGSSALLPDKFTGQNTLDQASQSKQDTLNNLIAKLHETQKSGGDTKKWLDLIGQTTGQPVTTTSDLYPALKKSNLQVTGDAAGTLLDILSAGSYGNAAKGAQTGSLLTKEARLAATPLVEQGAKQGLGQTIKTIAKDTAKQAFVGAGTGYAYDVAGNLQQGDTGAEALKPGTGALFGGAVPTVIGGIRAGVAISKDAAPRFINSLIKPKQADFSYGKDPGRTVSELGITGNNLQDFGDNINLHKNDIGTRIQEVYTSPENAKIRLNVDDEIGKLDDAIKEAAKGGKNNQSIVNTLQNTKDALLYEHGVNGDGVITKIGTTPRDLSSLDPEEVFNLKKEVASHTKFNGTPSDDKTVNSVLKDIYGSLKEKLNKAVGVNNPEIGELNQKYADLTSAELAVKNRDAIVKRSDLISLKSGGAGALGTAGALIAGSAALPATLIGIGAGALEKAMETTAVKSRIAAWLGSASPSTISRVFEQNPAIKTVIYRLLPKLESGNKADVSAVDLKSLANNSLNSLPKVNSSEAHDKRVALFNSATGVGSIESGAIKALSNPEDINIIKQGISYLRAPSKAEFALSEGRWTDVERIAQKLGVSLDQPFAKIANALEDALAKLKKK